MVTQPRILAFSGSTRLQSLNTKLCRTTATMIETAGAQVTVIDLGDYPMPLYEGDFETQSGPPKAANELKKLMREHHGFLIASPEYNGFFTPLLKNTIDWVSRPIDDEPPLAAFKGKTAALIAASPGATGGMRGLPHLRQLLSGIGVLVIPSQFALKHAGQAFDEQGHLTDDAAASSLTNIAESLTEIAGKLAT